MESLQTSQTGLIEALSQYIDIDKFPVIYGVSLAFIFQHDTKQGTPSIIMKTYDDQVYCYGPNLHGIREIGHYDSIDEDVPRRIDSLCGKQITNIVTGSRHAIALSQTGEVWGWGNNDYGQLGDGTNASKNGPVQVKFPFLTSKIVSIDCTSQASIALTEDSEIFTWGRNFYGELGVDGLSECLTPQRVNLPPEVSHDPVVSIRASWKNMFFLTQTGKLYSWGMNCWGTTGSGIKSSRIFTPILVNFPYKEEGIRQFSVGGNMCIVRDSHDRLWAWGHLERPTYSPKKLDIKSKVIRLISSRDDIVFVIRKSDRTCVYRIENGSNPRYGTLISKNSQNLAAVLIKNPPISLKIEASQSLSHCLPPIDFCSHGIMSLYIGLESQKQSQSCMMSPETVSTILSGLMTQLWLSFTLTLTLTINSHILINSLEAQKLTKPSLQRSQKSWPQLISITSR